MAINKNFVIKNGVEVNSNLIVGDSDTNRVGVGTTVPEYTLHVAGPNGIGATNLNVVGVGTIQNLRVVGVTTLTGDVTASGIVSANQFQVGVNTVVTSSRELQNITALDSTTTATIEEAIRVGPNSFSDLKVSGISTFVGIASFLGGIDVDLRSGVSTFSAPVQFGISKIDGQAGLSSNYVAVGATVGFGTSAFFRDNAAIFMGDSSELKIHHDGTHGWVRNVGGDFHIQPADGEEGIVAIGNSGIHLFYDDARKLHTTSGGIGVTGISTFTGRINVQTGVSTFQDSAKLTFGHQSDLIIWHDGSHSYIQDTTGTGNLYVDSNSLQIRNAAGNETQAVFTENGSVDLYFDNSKKVETTSGGLKVTGITTLTDRLHVQAGVSTFDADVRYGIGATVGFGTSAFLRDDAAIFFGNDSDLKIYHSGSHSFIQDVGTGMLSIDANQINFHNAAGTEYMLTALEDGAVSLYYDNSKKVETTSGGLNITGITTFSDRINVLSGVSTFADNAKLTFGDLGELAVYHSSGGDSAIRHSKTGAGNDLTIETATALYIGKIDLSETMASFQTDGAVSLYYDNANVFQTTPQGINVSGVTTSNRLNISGVSTFTSVGSNLIPDTDGSRSIGAATSEWQDLFIDGTAKIDTLTVDESATVAANLTVGTGVTIQPHGGVSIAGIVTVGGNLNVTGDIVYDEVSGRNINISGITTLGSGNGGVSGLLVTGAGYVGGGATVGSHAGIITYYGDGANLTGVTIGIGTTGDGSGGIHPVGYGVTYLEFKGAGFTTAYYDGNLGIATLCFQGGGGNAGAAGTWTPEGSIGISTSKSVGINTTALNDPDVQGIGNSFQGLYIGNGMLMVDNALNGNHYIGTNFNGMMAGPVTINGVLTIDGNYVVV